jgi:hypothetical protein
MISGTTLTIGQTLFSRGTIAKKVAGSSGEGRSGSLPGGGLRALKLGA